MNSHKIFFTQIQSGFEQKYQKINGYEKKNLLQNENKMAINRLVRVVRKLTFDTHVSPNA